MDDVAAIVAAVRAVRFRYSNEDDLQRGIAEALRRAGIAFEREAELGDAGRIDFLATDGVAVEAKIQGSPAEVARQVVRYAGSPLVRAVVLVTGRRSLGRLPAEILGKPVAVVELWETFL